MLAQEACLNVWWDFLKAPLGIRFPKPRRQGVNMLLDKGLGLGETRDLLHKAAHHIDFIKLAFGTSALYSQELLEEKIQLVRNYGVNIYPGGTFLEIAIWQNRLLEFLKRAYQLGFNFIEVSDGTIFLPAEVREKAINLALEQGFQVLTEVGKKDHEQQPCIEKIAELINTDLSLGAHMVIMEGREMGINVGLYDEKGNIRRGDLERLLEYIAEPDRIIWEAPQKGQQQALINRLGCNVNLGNIPPEEIIALEALRLGLRADTLKTALNDSEYSPYSGHKS
ncbi:MAG: phosphosulfolactate synthase [Bacillota bacterium]|uniref:phosphosulfolactate synthase n=1 Tax=Desulfurispora thermophila TaxID=265470 RepID=UPI00037BDF9E|nr:phosphosulfolactate synthase [Desulfurispora thermophila]